MTFSRHLTLLIISLLAIQVTSVASILPDTLVPVAAVVGDSHPGSTTSSTSQAGKAEVMGVLQMGKKALAVSDAHVMLVYLEDGERPDTLQGQFQRRIVQFQGLAAGQGLYQGHEGRNERQ